MKRKPVPSYLLHRQSGRARAVWTDPVGKRCEQLLPGPYNSQESRAAHARLLAELAASPAAIKRPTTGISVNELLLAYFEHAERYYAGDGGKEVGCIMAAVKPAREMYGMTPAAEFGPLALRAVRERMIALGWCRGLINRRINSVKRVFRWAASEQLIPVTNLEALRTLPGLRRGRSDARESEQVKPVDPSTVDSTLRFLNRHVRAMVELQRVTGMRPGEVCRLSLAEVDRSGALWVYRPAKHKTAHHGKQRTVMIGPKGRAVIEAFIVGGNVVDPSAPLFSPRRARDERFAAMRANRTSKVQPSQLDRRKAKPKRQPAEAYTTATYDHAVAAAAEKAGVAHWHPNQLRHTYASEVRKSHGLEAVQVLLGHSHANVTQVYAERDEGLAATVAAKIG